LFKWVSQLAISHVGVVGFDTVTSKTEFFDGESRMSACSLTASP
jgi:hypothetical protein